MLTTRSLFFLGDLAGFRAEAQRCATAAAERGDQLTFTMAQSVGLSRIHLLDGQPARAREESAEGIARWTKGEWHVQHQEDFRAQLQCDLYEGDGKRALERIAASWTRLQGSMLLRAQTERVQSHSLFAAAALGAKDVAAAGRWVKQLEREKCAWAKPHAVATRAGLLALEGSPEAANTYERAAVEFEALEMPLYAVAARRRRGELLGGAVGEEAVRSADAVLTERGVAEPPRFARVLVQ